MSYRERIQRQALDRSIESFEIAKSYRSVFGTPEGQFVLDHICTSLCGVDQVNQILNDIQAYDVIARRNVGITIAKLALGRDEDHKQPKVTT